MTFILTKPFFFMHNFIVTNDGLSFSFVLSLLSSDHNIIMFLHHGSNIYSAQQSVFKMANTNVWCNFSSCHYFNFFQVVQNLVHLPAGGNCTYGTLLQQQLAQSFLEAFSDLIKEKLCNNSKAVNAFHSLLMIDGHFKYYSGINIVK